MLISIITPVLNHPEFIDQYTRAVFGADEIIIVDTGSTPEHRDAWREMGTLIDYPHKGHNYGHWCNAGYAVARGDIVIFLNNDVAATGDWLSQVRNDVLSGTLYGPELAAQQIDGITIPFISGWCIAAMRETWERLRMFEAHPTRPTVPLRQLHGPWDTLAYPAAGYWEDNDLNLRAIMLDMALQQTTWPIVHLDGGNGTSKHKKDYYADVARNRTTFAASVRRAYAALQH